MTIDRNNFGLISVGDYTKRIYKFILKQDDASVSILNYGATIQSIVLPDKSGNPADIILGFDTREGYFGSDNPYFGSTVGRVANRIENGKIKVGDKIYDVSVNRPPNTLHGGFHGLDKKIWDDKIDGNVLTLSCISDHLEEGFPGYVEVKVVYEFTEDYQLKITLKAKTTLPTPINLTNHAYFNLAGHNTGSREVYDHIIFIDADSYTPVNEQAIPSGEITNVKGTPLDFTSPQQLGMAIGRSPANGFDYNYCINGYRKGIRLAARAAHSKSGRIMEVYTDQPGLQFYTGNFLNNIKGKNNVVYNMHSGFCFESQNYPNAVNIPCFPNSILDPANEYIHNIIFKFLLEK